MTRSHTPGPHKAPEPRPLSDAQIEERMDYIDGVNGSTGRDLGNKYLRELLRQLIAGTITAERARELGRQYLESGRRP